MTKEKLDITCEKVGLFLTEVFLLYMNYYKKLKFVYSQFSQK